MTLGFIRLAGICLCFAFFLRPEGMAQSLHPRIQGMVDSLQQWMQQQIAETGTVNDSILDDWNARIRAEQDRLNQQSPEETKKDHPGEEGTPRFLRKSGSQGSVFTVPEGKKWVVKRLMVTEGIGGYQIIVKSVEYPDPLGPGEKLRTPDQPAEIHLLSSSGEDISYIFEIEEFDLSDQ